MKIENTRPYEAILVSSAVVVYVVRRLLDVDNHLTTLIRTAIQAGVSRRQILADLAGYSHPLYAMFPIIGGAVLLLGAWLVFHLLVCPRVALQQFDKVTLTSVALSLALLFASLFLFHWYMEYVRYSQTRFNKIIGLKMFSLYRKKTVLADAIGICFVFVFFELVSNVFRYMQRQFFKEKEQFFKMAATVLVFIPGCILFYMALVKDPPTPLWSGATSGELLWIGSIVIIWVLQKYMTRYLLPNLSVRNNGLLQHLFGVAILSMMGTGIVWAAYYDFNFYYFRPFFAQLILTLFSAVIITIVRRTFFKEKIILQQQVAGTSAELAQLRSQINPHFLFNALNSLYAAAMKEKSEKTADGIQRLGDMMRFMLQENNQDRISIEKEIEYLHNYIHLQRIRIDETQGIEIKVILNQPDTQVYIAPMMLIPFVENAFKHGVSHRQPSWIFITLSFDATHLYFRVQNSRHIRQQADPEEYQSGIGLQNVRKRLDLLYPGRHTLQIQESDHDYIAALTLALW